MDEQNSYNKTIKDRQEKSKEELISILKEMPIIQVAVKRAGISRDTYYRWRRDDDKFLRQSEEALTQGVEYINDMSESQLIALIKEKKMPAIAMWLRNNNERYGAKLKQKIKKNDGINRNDPKFAEYKEIAVKYEDELRDKIVKEIYEQ